MLIQKKFKRLKVNAGFTFTPTAALCRKESEKEYRVLGCTKENRIPGYDGPTGVHAIKGNTVVWVDSFQVKPWWKL